MTSKLTRERLQEIAEDGFMKHGESKELARMALSAMDSEPVAWGNGCDKTVPAALRYLAENERPFGGESRFNAAHLYQLAREIELMAEAPLYRHAQQLVVPDDVLDALQKVARIRLDLNDFDGDRRGIADCLGDAEEALIEVVNRRADMLQGAKNSESHCGIQTAPALDSFKENADARCGNSPVIPDGSVAMLRRWLAFGRGMQNAGSQLPHNLIAETESMLAAAPTGIPMIPDGYVMVPKVATEKMLIAGLEEANPLGGLIDWDASRGDCNTREQVQEIFKAMLAAAPQEVKGD